MIQRKRPWQYRNVGDSESHKRAFSAYEILLERDLLLQKQFNTVIYNAQVSQPVGVIPAKAGIQNSSKAPLDSADASLCARISAALRPE